MSSTRIEPGDIVNVNINNVAMTLCSKAEVIHVPQATGDSWVFKDLSNGALIHCSEGITVLRPETW